MADYDVIVLGGGSAGTAAAAAASGTGARTLMVNEGELGGLCILRGCMPTKAMLASAHALHEARRLDPLGVRLEGRVSADFPAIMRRKTEQVGRFQRAKIESIEGEDYEVVTGRARFSEGGGVVVGDGRLSASAYVLATGSIPTLLPLQGIDDVPVWTSDDVMRLEAPPRALLVQGAGAVGLELAQFFARVGTRVLLVNRSPMLHREDIECGEELTRALADETGLELAVPGAIERLERTRSGLCAHVRSGDRSIRFEADALLMATGRRPALDDLGLEQVGLEPGPGGALERDETMRTRNPKIWVAGDATGDHQILHLANQEGRVAGHNAAGATPARKMDYRLAMSVVYTDPPFATVGLSEARGRQRPGGLIVGRARFPETGRAITMEVEHGLWKVLADPGSGEILGSSIIGPRADDLVHLITVLMRYRGTVNDLFELPWYHPTLSEVLLNIARDLARQSSIREPHCEKPWA